MSKSTFKMKRSSIIYYVFLSFFSLSFPPKSAQRKSMLVWWLSRSPNFSLCWLFGKKWCCVGETGLHLPYGKKKTKTNWTSSVFRDWMRSVAWVSYLLAESKLLFTKSLKGLMCSSFVNRTWFAMLCRICRTRQGYSTHLFKHYNC